MPRWNRNISSKSGGCDSGGGPDSRQVLVGRIVQRSAHLPAKPIKLAAQRPHFSAETRYVRIEPVQDRDDHGAVVAHIRQLSLVTQNALC